MNSIAYIRKHGVEKAREVVEGAPENSICYDLEQQKHVAYEDTSIAMCFLKNRFIDLSDIKHLVESVDLIRKVGGIDSAKMILSDMDCDSVDWDEDQFSYYGLLKQAIADYESIYGGEHV